ncbi:MAG TPA: IS21 family transposase [Dehalococcoidia bacterium]|nr:IS21 family transposase [Dehalococcoidia bacterium]
MPGRRKDTMDIRTLLLHIQTNPSDRGVQRTTGVDRRTVKRYRQWAQGQGLLTDSLPPLEELHPLLTQTLAPSLPPQNTSSVEPYRELVLQLRRQGTEIAAIRERLKERGYTGSYSAVYRFVRALDPRGPAATVRVERPPGQEAQVDFGYAGRLLDPTTGLLRKAWAFVMTLAFSRHQYVEFVWDQKVETWLLLHRHAFQFFGGVPERVVIDNLKAAITGACWDDPQVQYAYQECAEHYGFRIAPCRPATPQHKGKVEQGGVHYVKRNFLGGREPVTLEEANTQVREWCLGTAGQRLHGTTREQPLARFQGVEQARLQPLPEAPYDLAIWKKVELYRDCYITFDKAYYSAPFRYVGQTLWVRGGSQTVRIYSQDYQLLATHSRAQRPGERQTQHDHLPPHKVPGLLLDRQDCQTRAANIGPATSQVVQTWLADPVLDRLPTVGRLLRLRERFGEGRLEAACQRASRFEDPSYRTIKGILGKGLEKEEPAEIQGAPAACSFVRSAAELVGHLLGGGSWS